MKKHRYWIIAVAIILTGILYVGYGFAKEKEPIREPVYESPRVYTNSSGKVVFKEFFEDLTVNRIEFFDPDSGKLLYGVTLQDGRLVGEREGMGVGENDGTFDPTGEIDEYKYFTINGKTLLRTYEYNGELLRYSVIVGEASRPLALSIDLKQGSVKRATREFRLNNEKVHFKRRTESDTYEEIYFHNDGSDTKREYKSGFLEREHHTSPGEVRSYILSHRAYYLRGKHAFTVKNKYNKENFKEEVAVYDSNDKLVSKANLIFGESLYLEEDTVNGRKGLQVIYKGPLGKKKVEATKFEE